MRLQNIKKYWLVGVIPLVIFLMIVYSPKSQIGASVFQVYQGGTGATSFSAGQCLVGAGTGAITTQACGVGGGGSLPAQLGQIGDVSTTTLGAGYTLSRQGSLWQSTSTLNISATGNIGIGTTTPIYKLHVVATSTNASAVIIDDGLGTLGEIGIAGYGSLLTLNVVNASNDYQITYISELTGKVANFVTSGGGLEFDHYDLSDNLLGSNVLLGYGGVVTWASAKWGGAYRYDANRFAIGEVTDVSVVGNNPMPNIIFDIVSHNVGIGTSSPYASLSVSGRGVFDQDIRANYFTATSTIASVFPNASSTAFSSNYASSTFYHGAGLANCLGKLLWSNGMFSCGIDSTGSGGAGTVATSTSPTTGQLAYWTSKDAWPETLGSVATTTLTEDSLSLSLSQPISVIGGTASVLSLSTSTLFTFDGSGACGSGLVCTGGHTHDMATLTWDNDWMIAYSNGSGLVELPLNTGTGKFLMSNGEAAPTWETAARPSTANTFTLLNTFSNATTTLLSATYASSTFYYGAGLASCNAPTSALTWNNGRFGCNTIAAGGDMTKAVYDADDDGKVTALETESYNLTDLTDVTTAGETDAQLLIYQGTPTFLWQNKSMSGNCSITAAGAITCFGGTIGSAETTAEDWGSFSCTGAAGGCALDASSVSLTTNVTGILPTANGGTGLGTGGLAATFIPFGAGTSAFATSSGLYFNSTTLNLFNTYASSTAQTISGTSYLTTVGVGTTSPFAILSVNAAAGATSFLIGSSASTYFIVDTTGKVGISTSSPSQQLAVNGSLYLTGALYNNTQGAGSNFQILQSTGTATRWVSTSSLFTAGTSTLPIGTQGQMLSVQSALWQATSSLTISATGILTLTNASTTNITVTGYASLATLLGAIDAGGATSFEIPNGGPTVDTTGEIGIDTTSGQFKWSYNGATVGVKMPYETMSFNISSSSWGTGTTTVAMAPAMNALTMAGVYCETSAGTLGVSLYDGTNRANYIATASTTKNYFGYNTNNTFTASESIRVDVGTAATSPTWIACRFKFTYDAD